MIYIRLSDGCFQWSRTEEEARTLSGEEFLRLMDGFAIDPSIGKKSLKAENTTLKKEKQEILKALEMLHHKWSN